MLLKQGRGSIHRAFALAPRLFGWTIALGAAAGIATVIVLVGAKRLVDGIDQGVADSLSIVMIAGGFLLTGFVRAVTAGVQRIAAERASRQVQRDVMLTAATVPFVLYERPDVHDLLERVSRNAPSSVLRVVSSVAMGFEAILGSIAVLAVLLVSVPALVPWLCLVGLPLVLASRWSARLAYGMAIEVTENDRFRRSIATALTGRATARDVRIFGLHRTLERRWNSLWNARLDAAARLAWRGGLAMGAASAVSGVGVALVLWLVVRRTSEGEIAIGDAAAVVLAVQQLVQRTRSAAQAAGSFREASLFLDDHAAVVGLATAEDRPFEPLPLTDRITLENVSFRYPSSSADALRRVDLDLRRGELVAIVGPNGAGKSTLLHLIVGLYSPSSGRITWDGVDAATQPADAIWQSTSATFQEFGRYELTVRENIEIGDDTISTVGRAEQAAARAGLEQAIAGLGNGYDTVLSRFFPGGEELSVGQWQRLAVARALYRPAPLLVLDEPAAALDPEAESALIETLRTEAVDRVVLMTSHRFSSVRRADRIIVVEEGAIVEDGSHDELLELNGRYAELFKTQMGGD